MGAGAGAGEKKPGVGQKRTGHEINFWTGKKCH